MAKLLHVLGGGRWQLPTIRLAKSLGHRVLVTDIFPERPGYALADAYEVVDISDRERTLEVARQHRIDGILCDTTDVGVPTAAFVAERLGLPGMGYETALNFTDKARMRSVTQKAGLANVRFRLASSPAQLGEAADEIGYPVVVKPPDNQSSRGVHKVDGPAALPAAFDDAVGFTRGTAVLVEQFLPGREITVEGFCLHGHYFTTGISDKGHFVHRPEVANRLTYPADLDGDTMARLQATNEKIVRCLGLASGVTHAEYIVDGSEINLVEIAARGGGSLIHSDIIPYLSGIDVLRCGIELALGEQPTVQRRVGQARFSERRPTIGGGIGHGGPALASSLVPPYNRSPSLESARAANLAFFEFPSGKVTAIEGVDEARKLPGVHEILLEFAVGDTLTPPDDDRSRPGLLVAFGGTRADVLATSEAAFRLVRVSVER